MKKDTNAPEPKKSFLDRYKNAKFIFINVLVLAALAFALLAGDGGTILSNFYQKVTGVKLENFSPATNISSQPYQILKFKLAEESIDIAATKVEIFKPSDSAHKYRVTTNEQTLLFIVEKQANGIWQVKPLEH